MGAVVVGCADTGGTTASISPSTTSTSFAAGEGSITGARNLLKVNITGVSIKRVTRNGTTLNNHRLFIDGTALKIGNRSDVTGDFTLGDATGDVVVTLSHANAPDVTVDIAIKYGIAIYKAINKDRNDGNWQGNFGYNRCTQFLNASQESSADTLKQALLRDGYSASKTKFVGSTSNYHFITIYTDGDGLGATASLTDADIGARPLQAYTATRSAATITTRFNSNRITLQQLVGINTSNGNWQNNGGTVISTLIGTATFWAFSGSNGQDNSIDCENSSTASVSFTGSFGNATTINSSGQNCNNYRAVLCVAK